MAKKEKIANEPKKQGGKRATLRANARARRKGLYAAHFSIAEKNGRRRLTRHVRAHPQDALARMIHEKRVGATDSLKLTGAGRKRLFIAERGLDAWRAQRKSLRSGVEHA